MTIHRESKGVPSSAPVAVTFEGLDSSKKYHDKVLAKDGKSHRIE